MLLQHELLRSYLRSNQPVVMTGRPGIGKTFAIVDEFEQSGGFLITCLGSVREPTDIAGWPYRTDKGVLLDAPHYAKVAIEAQESGKYSMVGIFYDELRRCVPAVQNALLRVFLEGIVGDITLPREIRRIAASNHAEDGGWPLESALANRLGHIDVEVDHDVFQKGFVTNTFRPLTPIKDPETRERLREERAWIASFLHKRSELLIRYPEDEEKRDGPWPSPRSWDMGAHVLAHTPHADKNLRTSIIGTAVGMGAAIEALGWLEAQDLPNPEDTLYGRVKDVVDQKRPDRTYAVVSAALSLAFQSLEGKEAVAQKAWDAGWTLVARVKTDGAADIAGSFIPEFYRKGETCRYGLRQPDEEIALFADLLERAGLGGVE